MQVFNTGTNYLRQPVYREQKHPYSLYFLRYICAACCFVQQAAQVKHF